MQIYFILYSGKGTEKEDTGLKGTEKEDTGHEGTEKEDTGHSEQSSVFLDLQLMLNTMYIFVHYNSM